MAAITYEMQTQTSVRDVSKQKQENAKNSDSRISVAHPNFQLSPIH